eukprot:6186418-Pleurochrysis_carterae.AAC.1
MLSGVLMRGALHRVEATAEETGLRPCRLLRSRAPLRLQAFAAAHAAIRSVMLRRQPTMLLVGGGAERKAVDATPESPSRA